MIAILMFPFLAANEQSPRSIGNLAQLDYIFFTPYTVSSMQETDMGATSLMTIKNYKNSANHQKQRCQPVEIFSGHGHQSWEKWVKID